MRNVCARLQVLGSASLICVLCNENMLTPFTNKGKNKKIKQQA